ncbi:MAG: hypothetical protein ACI8RP_001775 [Urechidicola sp.]|jgi:hypothetical protein
MAHNTKIYGYINGAAWNSEDYYKLHRLNSEIINLVPNVDNNFPFINRSMFSIPDEQGVFRQQIITFGASYKTLEYEWDLWLDKFENILKKLYWWDAKIFVDFEVMGQYVYEWEIDLNKRENWWKDKPEPITEWNYKSDGPRLFFNK